MVPPPVYGFVKNALIEEGRIVQGDLDKLRTWLKNETLPDLSDEQLVLFSLSCDNNHEATKRTIRAFYEAKKSAPELFDGWDVNDDGLRSILSSYFTGVFPKRTDDGHLMAFIKINDLSYRDYSYVDSSRLLMMAIDCALYDYPPTGLIIFIDVEGFTLMHLTKIKVGTVKKLLYYLQEGLPVKLKAIHVMNTVYFIDKAMALFRPFMKKELFNMLHFHTSPLNVDEFSRKFVARELLPQDYGGTMPPLVTLHGNFCEKLTELREFFVAEEKQRKSL